MIRIGLLVAGILAIQDLSAQRNLMFDTSAINKSTKLVGQYPYYDKEKKFRHLNFWVTDPEKIKEIIKSLEVGPQVENFFTTKSFDLFIINGYDKVRSWTINPIENTASYNGRTYQFDTRKIKNLAKLFPFDYRHEKIIFKDQLTYTRYLEKQKSDSLFFFHYPPSFTYEGSFKIKFPKNNQYSSPKAIITYLKPIIEKIVPTNEYLASYALDKENLDDHKNYVITIKGSKKLFDELQVPGLTLRAWEPSIEEGTFFYRTK